MSELISGKEALIALANGGGVIYINTCYKDRPLKLWGDAKECNIEQFLSGDWIFRLKPKTIMLNGIEVAENIKKRDKDQVVWVVNTSCENWYDWIYGSDCDSNTLYWGSEEEIKQVVAALRSIFNAN